MLCNHRWLVFLTFLAAIGPARGQSADVKGKKLIEFGWDEPSTSFLRTHAAEMQHSPFAGCVFHVDYKKTNGAPGSFTWQGWDRQLFTETDLRQAFDDARALRPGRFKCNFLRFNTTPAKLDWFDDYSAVIANAQLAARLARAAHCTGILFDIEQYDGPLFNYHKQRDAGTKSWELYAAQARRRGGEVMRAFHEGDPGLTLLLTFGYSLPWAQTEGGKKSLADCAYGLLAPFLDGMVEAARGGDKIVDGYELSYGYKTAAQFAGGRNSMREGVLPLVRDADKYRRVFSSGFGLWLDYDSQKKGWDAEDPAKNYFTPEAFTISAREALRQSDEYVWIYSQTPRWWSAAGTTVKLPAAYETALRAARGE